jgi:hypothetical protein
LINGLISKKAFKRVIFVKKLKHENQSAMKKLKAILFVLILSTSTAVFADEVLKPVAVRCKVVDKVSGEALAGVKVNVEGTHIDLYTDLEGTFVIDRILPGAYSLKLSFISYEDLLIDSFVVIPGGIDEMNLELDPEL